MAEWGSLGASFVVSAVGGSLFVFMVTWLWDVQR